MAILFKLASFDFVVSAISTIFISSVTDYLLWEKRQAVATGCEARMNQRIELKD